MYGDLEVRLCGEGKTHVLIRGENLEHELYYELRLNGETNN